MDSALSQMDTLLRTASQPAQPAQQHESLHVLAVNPFRLRRHLARLLAQASSLLDSAAPSLAAADYTAALQKQSDAVRGRRLLHTALRDCVMAAACHASGGNRSRITERAFELMCADLGLQFLAEPSEVEGGMPAITICGSIVVVDMVFEVSGRVDHVKLSIAPEVDRTDPHAEALLTHLARTHDLNAFRGCLETLAFLDTLTGSSSGVDLFQCLRSVEADLKSLFETEMEMTGSVDRVLMTGHGLPRFHSERWGPSVLYWCDPATRASLTDNPEAVRGASETPGSGNYFKAFIGMEDGPDTRFLPPSRSQYLVAVTDEQGARRATSDASVDDGCDLVIQQMEWCQPKAAGGLDAGVGGAAPATFVLQLVPAVVVTGDAAVRLAAMCDATASDGADMATDEEGGGAPDSVPKSYEDLLFGNLTPARQRGDSEPGKHDDHELQFVFSCPTQTAGVRVSRVPFDGPSKLAGIFKILRQHAVFEQLFKSAFGVPGELAQQQTHAASQHTLDVVHWDPPRSVGVAFLHARPPHVFRVDVRVSEECHVTVALWTASAHASALAGGQDAHEWTPFELGSEQQQQQMNDAAAASLDMRTVVAATLHLLDASLGQ
ncbi:hypothetical protein BC831DRAFT_469524 [Entophlyctis helioformis]|nr:hypothetical protein BC831DRAFT_469524 [Entophlyctis helioformis]